MKWHMPHQDKTAMKMIDASLLRAACKTAVRLLLCSSLALTVQPAQAGFDEAAAAFAAGDYAKALQETRPLAESGDARGEYGMGVFYENGYGVTKDLKLAAAWYLKAAKQGNSRCPVQPRRDVRARRRHGGELSRGSALVSSGRRDG
jgi:hypothetical protein